MLEDDGAGLSLLHRGQRLRSRLLPSSPGRMGAP